MGVLGQRFRRSSPEPLIRAPNTSFTAERVLQWQTELSEQLNGVESSLLEYFVEAMASLRKSPPPTNNPHLYNDLQLIPTAIRAANDGEIDTLVNKLDVAKRVPRVDREPFLIASLIHGALSCGRHGPNRMVTYLTNVNNTLPPKFKTAQLRTVLDALRFHASIGTASTMLFDLLHTNSAAHFAEKKAQWTTYVKSNSLLQIPHESMFDSAFQARNKVGFRDQLAGRHLSEAGQIDFQLDYSTRLHNLAQNCTDSLKGGGIDGP